MVIADSIEDPHNLGALIRCAECAGAHGVIIPRRRSAGLTPVVSKASAGALEHLAIAKVPNIAQTVTELKKRGLWVFVAEAGGTAYYDADFQVPAAIVFGSEGAGVAKTVREKKRFYRIYSHVWKSEFLECIDSCFCYFVPCGQNAAW